MPRMPYRELKVGSELIAARMMPENPSHEFAFASLHKILFDS